MNIYIRRVSNLDDENFPQAIHVAAEALKADPLHVPLVGGDRRLTPSMFRGYIGAAIVGGEVCFAEVDGKVVGVACWFPPGKEFLHSPEQHAAGWDEYVNALSDAGRKWQNDIFVPSLDAAYARSLPTPTSKLDGYYLSLLVVLPSFHGKGIGGKLLFQGLEKARKEGVVLCLETYTPQNIEIYKHWGLRVGGTHQMTSQWEGDFTMTIMVWESGTNDS